MCRRDGGCPGNRFLYQHMSWECGPKLSEYTVIIITIIISSALSECLCLPEIHTSECDPQGKRQGLGKGAGNAGRLMSGAGSLMKRLAVLYLKRTQPDTAIHENRLSPDSNLLVAGSGTSQNRVRQISVVSKFPSGRCFVNSSLPKHHHHHYDSATAEVPHGSAWNQRCLLKRFTTSSSPLLGQDH